jgi:L-lactate dehydrogenase
MATKVAIIGAGNVGATFAYGLLMTGVANEIVLIDANREKAEGEMMDLEHAQAFAPATRISVGERLYSDCADASVIVLTAGAARKPGDSRLDLLRKNYALLQEIIPSVVRYNPTGILVIATNPVDVLTYAALQISGLPCRQVIGSGTILDTARFRALLGQHFAVDPHSVHAHIIGEHGDSEVPVWSLANIAGMQLPSLAKEHGFADERATLNEIFARTRDAGAAVIKRKGATFYAIASSLVTIVAAILRDQNTVFSVSSLISNYYGIDDVCLSLPTVLNRSGIKEVLRLELSPYEQQQLQHSAEVLRSSIAFLRN